MNDPVASRLVEAIIADFPDHKSGTRPIHTIGIGVKGTFEPSEVARNYCIAEHFQPRPDPVRVTVRFSNGSGSPRQHDGWNDVRGMATRFHLGGERAYDLIAMTLGGFFVRSVDEFFDFTEAAHQSPVAREKPGLKILDMLSLTLPLPDPPPGQNASGDAGTLDYANKHRFAQLAVFQAGMIGAPVSYVRAVYHAVHTFFVVGPDGVRRPVRFSWKPVAGVETTKDTSKAPCDRYLQEELTRRLKKPAGQTIQPQPARMMLMMMIGEAGDVLEDPTVPWPAHRQRVVMGTLSLTEVAEDQEFDCEKMSFNPWRLVEGIQPSADPLLKARRNAYEHSRNLRGVTKCPFLPE